MIMKYDDFNSFDKWEQHKFHNHADTQYHRLIRYRNWEIEKREYLKSKEKAKLDLLNGVFIALTEAGLLHILSSLQQPMIKVKQKQKNKWISYYPSTGTIPGHNDIRGIEDLIKFCKGE